MKIIIKKLSLLNFKGIRDLVIEFDEVTNIFGDNATGKTTIFDAFLWLLFGKDSTDRKDFEIKTLDSKNRPIHKLDHEVSAVLEINGEEVTVRRLFKEIWQTTRGKSAPEFTRHTTEFFWNDVPLQLKDYSEKITGLIDEGIFKLLTNTAYFNNMKWQDRRDVLMKIAGEITDGELAEGDTEFEALLKSISGKTLKEFKDQIAARKKKLKDQLEEIPARRQEAERAMPDPIDYGLIERQIATKQGQLTAIEEGLQNEANAAKEKNATVRKKIDEVHDIQTKIQGIEFDIRKGINAASQQRQSVIAAKKNELRLLTDSAQRNSNEIVRIKAEISSMQNERKDLGAKWSALNAKQFAYDKEFKFEENECTCPTCKQRLPEDSIATRKAQLKKNFDDAKERALTTFNTEKAADLKRVTDRGNALKADIEARNKRLSEIPEDNEAAVQALQIDISSLEAQHARLTDNEGTEITVAIANNKEIASLKENAAVIQSEIDQLDKPDDNKMVAELKDKKQNLVGEIDGLKMDLHGKTQREQQQARIAELDRQEQEYSQQIADLEGTEFTITRFERAKMDLVESRVNEMFRYVQFKMFDTQINGAEVPACITLINGVPYADANSAARINAGLDIIRVISEYYNKKVPVFVDNAESVTRLLQIDSQVVRLVVSALDKKLRVQSEQLAVA
jgi:exonuclease SbcC